MNNFYLKPGDQPRISWDLENIRHSRIKADLGRTGEARLTQNQSRFFETGGSPRISWDLGQPTQPRIKADLGRTKNKLRPWTVPLTKEYSESWKNKRLCLTTENIIKIIISKHCLRICACYQDKYIIHNRHRLNKVKPQVKGN